MATSLTLRNDPTLQQGYVQVNGTTSATFTTTGITGNLTGNVTGNVTGNADTATKLSTTTGSAPSYACRAWVNFNGTGTIGTNQTIRASGNVSSVLKNATGDYTITFTTPMADANYAWQCGGNNYLNGTGNDVMNAITTTTYQTSSSLRIITKRSSGGGTLETSDHSIVTVAIFS